MNKKGLLSSTKFLTIFCIFSLFYGFDSSACPVGATVGSLACPTSGAMSSTDYILQQAQQSCEAAATNFGKARSDLTSKCYGKEVWKCNTILESCDHCPEGNFDEDEEDEDAVENPLRRCISVPKSMGNSKKICPELAGKALKQAEEDLDEYEEGVRDLTEDISDIQGNIIEKQGELAEEVGRFEETQSEIQASFTEIKEELDTELENNKQQIDQSVKEQIAQLEEEIGQSLKRRHAFENAVTDAHTQLRAEKNKIFFGCRNEASQRLYNYRKQRRKAIASGAYKKSSITKLLNKNRISLGQKDDARFKHYYSLCIKSAKDQIKELETGHKELLKRISQKKREYLDGMKRLQAKLLSYTKEAEENKNKLVQTYYTKMQTHLKTVKKQENILMKNFQRKQHNISQQLQKLNQDKIQKQGSLEEKQNKLRFNRELIAKLNAKDIDDEHTKEKKETASAALEKYKTELTAYRTSCCAKILTDKDESKCETANEVYCSVYNEEKDPDCIKYNYKYDKEKDREKGTIRRSRGKN